MKALDKWVTTTAYPAALFLGMMLTIAAVFGGTLALITWFLNG